MTKAEPGDGPGGDGGAADGPGGPDDGPGAGGSGDGPDGPGGRVPGAGIPFNPPDEERRRGVRRMKPIATGFLVAATVVYGLANWAGAAGAGSGRATWPRRPRPAWSARSPTGSPSPRCSAARSGLPIPHTAIIPTQEGRARPLARRLRRRQLPVRAVVRDPAARGRHRRAGSAPGWREPAHAERVTGQASAALRGALTVLRDERRAGGGRRGGHPARRPRCRWRRRLGRLLRAVRRGRRRTTRWSTCCAERGHDWLLTHPERGRARGAGERARLDAAVRGRAGGRAGLPGAACAFVAEVRDEPDHPAAPGARPLPGRLRRATCGPTRTPWPRVERLKQRPAGAPARCRTLSTSLVGRAARAWSSPPPRTTDSELRLRVRDALRLARRPARRDERLRAKVDGWVEDAAALRGDDLPRRDHRR